MALYPFDHVLTSLQEALIDIKARTALKKLHKNVVMVPQFYVAS